MKANAVTLTSRPLQAHRSRHARGNGRLQVDVLFSEPLRDTLARDVVRGLGSWPKVLPPKYFYDDRGSALFDAICDLPEYYLTRVSHELLAIHADDIVAVSHPREIIELGSGSARKTRVLLSALARRNGRFRYLPFDVSEGTLRRAAVELMDEYPMLSIHAMVGDYERDLERLPPGQHRLVLFLGSTIGNFTPAATADFLARLRAQLSPGEHLLIGTDLVKAPAILEAAYNDSAGVTAEFNRNVLHVINDQLDGDFEPERFAHVAFFNQTRSQIEMHLRARTAQTVSIRALDLTIDFAAGEMIHTEISRKFTREEVELGLDAAGFQLLRWYTPSNNFFALALAGAV